jgi:YesN/AraC family two-component response regulator
VGIENAKYFRQVFQKLYGTTPSDYAKQHRAAQAASEVE